MFEKKSCNFPKAHEMTKNVLERANKDKDSLEQKLRVATKAGAATEHVTRKPPTGEAKGAPPAHEVCPRRGVGVDMQFAKRFLQHIDE